MNIRMVYPRRFIQDENGSATVLALFFCLIILIIGGMAVDFQKRQADSQYLQNAADSAAHAALLTRQSKSESVAISEALKVVRGMLPRKNMQEAITSADFTFGTWDYDTRTFTPAPGAVDAVRVYAGMTKDRGNSTPNLLLYMIGFDSFNVAEDSIQVLKRKPCSFQGLLAEGVLTIDSGNFFGPSFCLHSNTYVSLRTNNYFTADNYADKILGSKVSMPHIEKLDIPDSAYSSNTNLEGAKAEGWYNLSSLDELPNIITNLELGVGLFVPSTVLLKAPTPLTLSEFRPTDIAPGLAHRHNCAGGKIIFKSGTYEDFTLVTDCQVEFSSNVILKNVVIATRNTSAQAFYSSSGLQLGVNDDCAIGGGATLLSLGGFYANANFSAYGGVVWARGDIYFHARAQKIEGLSMKTQGSLTATSEAEMRVCETSPILGKYAEYGPRLMQ
ncbi:hypothetical protein SuNHUV7_24700 (plasmid) [Pseudoseohaeicola sp. NH-UV-7]|uniref:pilus assembly protein TadG-related protein n=1 Tax=Sulfitobacter sp. TBRI5 TaxID=2989732 RepID=UPI003A73CD06